MIKHFPPADSTGFGLRAMLAALLFTVAALGTSIAQAQTSDKTFVFSMSALASNVDGDTSNNASLSAATAVSSSCGKDGGVRVPAKILTFAIASRADNLDVMTVNNDATSAVSVELSNADCGLLFEITKQAERPTTQVGDFLRWTIEATSKSSTTIEGAYITDTLPASIQYLEGSTRLSLNGVQMPKEDPEALGRQLSWKLPAVPSGGKVRITFISRVGLAQVGGRITNIAQAFSGPASKKDAIALSVIAEARVEVRPSALFDCPTIFGKVFEDHNGNAQQDAGEEGLQGVKIYGAKGLKISVDRYGRYSVPCPFIVDQQRGSNFILKVDEDTLPRGCMITTENPRVVRLTPGMNVKANFAVTCPTPARVQLCDAAYAPNSDRLSAQWQPKLAALIERANTQRLDITVTYATHLTGERPRARLKALIDYLKAQTREAGLSVSINAVLSTDTAICQTRTSEVRINEKGTKRIEARSKVYAWVKTIRTLSENIQSQDIPQASVCQFSLPEGSTLCEAFDRLWLEKETRESLPETLKPKVLDYHNKLGEWQQSLNDFSQRNNQWTKTQKQQYIKTALRALEQFTLFKFNIKHQ